MRDAAGGRARGGLQATSAQRLAGDKLYRDPARVRDYAELTLRPAEALILLRHRDAFSGRVLELGCGTGRITGYLAQLAEHVTAVDLSPAMIEHCRAREIPRVSFEIGDLRDLSALASAGHDAIVAGFNVLDVLDTAARERALLELHRLLAPSGLLVFSGHNLAAAGMITPPGRPIGSNRVERALDLSRVPRRVRNQRRAARHEVRADGHAILNDEAHDYRLLHYYTGRDRQQEDLERSGFELLECRELSGELVPAGEPAAHCPELHYVARRSR